MKPHCFKNIDPQSLSILWKANKKAWMTTVVFTEWITKFNENMKRLGKKVLLLLDNAPAHPHDLELSNVVLKYLPANTTSMLQPLDLGIIKNFKSPRQLRAVLSKLESASDASEVAKSINVLDACNWIRGAMDDINPVTCGALFQESRHEA